MLLISEIGRNFTSFSDFDFSSPIKTVIWLLFVRNLYTANLENSSNIMKVAISKSGLAT